MKSNLSKSKNTVGRTRAYKHSFNVRYVRIVLWILGIRDHTHFLELMRRIEFYKDKSGTKFVVLYLKEALRLVQHWKSGNFSTAIPGGVRVASRRGLPTVIPGQLRLQLERGDRVALRAVLTLLSIFRI